MTPEDLISTRRAAQILGRSVATVRRYARAGKLRGWKVAGGQLAVSEAEVRALLVPKTPWLEAPAKAEPPGQRERVLERLRRAGVVVR